MKEPRSDIENFMNPSETARILPFLEHGDRLRRFMASKWMAGPIGGARGGASGHEEAIDTSLGRTYGSGKGAV